MSERVWLSGATGFLGSQIAARLGDAAVLTSRSGGEVGGRPVAAVNLLDGAAVEASARGCDAAILCAGAVSRRREDAALMQEIHVKGTKDAFLAFQRAGVGRVVLVSTSGTLAVGNDPHVVFDETAPPPLRFISDLPYYRSKYYGERSALEMGSEAFEVVVVNPSLLLGPGDLRESSTSDVRRFLEKALMAIPPGGVAFVDVRDAAAGVVSALQRGRAGERYLLNAANMTLATFFGRLSRISGVPLPLLRLPRHAALSSAAFGLFDRAVRAVGGTPPIDEESVRLGQLFWYCSAAKAERELDFVARDPGDTLRETVFDLVDRKVVAPLEMRRPELSG